MIVFLVIILIIIVLHMSRIEKGTNDNDGIKLITKKKYGKYKYYPETNKKVRFYDTPEYNKCYNEEDERDKFISEYVFGSRIFCDKDDTKGYTNLANYRRDFFDFRDKTNVNTNQHTMVDNIAEMILLKPELHDKTIAEIYDTLTSNKFNYNYDDIKDTSNEWIGKN